MSYFIKTQAADMKNAAIAEKSIASVCNSVVTCVNDNLLRFLYEGKEMKAERKLNTDNFVFGCDSDYINEKKLKTFVNAVNRDYSEKVILDHLNSVGGTITNRSVINGVVTITASMNVSLL